MRSSFFLYRVVCFIKWLVNCLMGITNFLSDVYELVGCSCMHESRENILIIIKKKKDSSTF